MSNTRESRLGWAILAAIMAVVAGIEQASGGTQVFRDNLYYFMPQFEACRQSITGGELPLWNPYMGCGHPLMATLQCAVASPLSLPFLILPYVIAIKVFWVIAMLTATGGMFALALRAGLTPSGACLAAIMYAGAGPMRSLTEWPPIIQGMALLPVLLVAFHDLLRGARGGVIATALLGSLQLLVGQPRQAVFAALACLLWALAFRPAKVPLKGILARTTGAVSLAICFSAIQFLPSLELFWYSERHIHGVPPSTVRESFLSLKDLFTSVLAKYWGDENRAFGPGRLLVPRLYIGWFGLWLATSGAMHAKGRTHFFSLLAIITGFSLALAEPAYNLIFQAATESHTLRYMGHMVLPAFIGISLLAGAAFDRFCLGTRGKIRTTPLILFPAFITAFILVIPLAPVFLVFTGWPQISPLYGAALSAVRLNAIVSATLLGLAWYLLIRFPQRAIVRISLPIVLALDLLFAFHGYGFKVGRAFFDQPPLLNIQGIREGRIFIPASSEQIYPDSSPISMQERYRGRWNISSPNITQMFHLRNPHGYEPFRLESQNILFGPWERGTAPVTEALKATGARWAILPAHMSETGWRMNRILAGAWALYEIPDTRDLAEVLPGSILKSGWLKLNNIDRSGTSEIREIGWNGLSASANASRDSMLLIRNSWYPGWNALVNGIRTPVFTAGEVFMAVPVRAGRSSIELTYSPLSFKFGLFISCLALTSALWAGLIALFSAYSSPNTRD